MLLDHVVKMRREVNQHPSDAVDQRGQLSRLEDDSRVCVWQPLGLFLLFLLLLLPRLFEALEHRSRLRHKLQYLLYHLGCVVLAVVSLEGERQLEGH